MIYSGLEIKGHQNKKLGQVVQYFRKNNINTLRDIEDIKRDNIKVFKFWNETGVDIESLEIAEYFKPRTDFSFYCPQSAIIYEDIDIERTLGFRIIKFIVSLFLLIGMLGYLIIIFNINIVRMI